jgi:hypothetical protein
MGREGGNTLQETYMVVLVWKTKIDDLHKRGNAKEGRGKRWVSISSHLKSYQKIDEPKGHEDIKVG